MCGWATSPKASPQVLVCAYMDIRAHVLHSFFFPRTHPPPRKYNGRVYRACSFAKEAGTHPNSRLKRFSDFVWCQTYYELMHIDRPNHVNFSLTQTFHHSLRLVGETRLQALRECRLHRGSRQHRIGSLSNTSHGSKFRIQVTTTRLLRTNVTGGDIITLAGVQAKQTLEKRRQDSSVTEENSKLEALPP